MKKARTRALCFLHFAFCILTSVFLPACNTIGAVSYKVLGPTPVPAKFEPAKEPTAIIVENYRNPALGQIDANRLSRQMVLDFEEHKVAPVVDPDKLGDLYDRNPDAYKKMSIPALGRAAGAKQVVYVDLVSAQVDRDSARQTARGQMSARVRVVDATTGNSLWPLDTTGGYEVNIQTGYSTTTDDDVDKARAKTIRDMSDQITKLFYKWRPDLQMDSDKAQEK